MIIETRIYTLKPHFRERFLEISAPSQFRRNAEIGMKILGPLLSVEDEDAFFVMRGFS